MKKILTLLLLSFFGLTTQIYGQVAGSFNIITMKWRFDAPTEQYLASNGYITMAKTLSHAYIFGSGDPNKANMTLVKGYLDKFLPDVNTAQYFMINWEVGPYVAMREYPVTDPRFIAAETEIIRLITEIKKLRPNLKVSVYNMPYRMWFTSKQLSGWNGGVGANEKFNKVLAKVDFIAPSLYTIFPDEEVGKERNIQYLKDNLDLALYYGKKLNKPVIPYVWHRVAWGTSAYQKQIIQKSVFAETVRFIATYSYNNYKAASIWWYDGSGQFENYSGINNCLNGTVYDQATYYAMIRDYAKHVKTVLTAALTTTTTTVPTTTTEPTTTTTEPTTTLDKTAPVVTGVSDGGIYNTERRIYFNEGTATLNNVAFNSNTLISAAAVYTLVVTDVAGNVTTVRFEIDKTKPTATLLINNNAPETNTVNVTLNMTHQGGAVQMRFLNNGVWGAWEAAATTKAWTLTAGDGSKTASVQFRDAAGNISASAYDGIILKQATQYSLTVAATNGSVTKSPNQTSYANGSTVTLTATPAPGYQFSGWSGGATGTTNPLAVTMNGNKSITANFIPVPVQYYSLTVGAVGSGMVTKSIEQGRYAKGTIVTLIATPATGYQFFGWSGNTNGTTNPLPITIDSATSITANFIPVLPEYSLTVGAIGSGMVTKSVEQNSYSKGTIITLTATPAAGYQFSGWSGDTTGTTNPLAVTVKSNKNITATFTLVQQTTEPSTASKIVTANIENSLTTTANIYPNPATTNLHVEVGIAGEGVSEITLNDLAGRVVLTKRISNHGQSLNADLDVQNLESGIYIVSVNTPKGRTSKRVVVK